MRDNIEAFGGDPARVMIYGQSGGAGKVVNLLGMPQAAGLFHSAAVQSGGARGGDPSEASAAAERLLAAFGLSKSNARDLQKVPLDQLMKVAAGARNDAVVRAGAEGLEFRWGPVIDGAVLPADPNASPISKDVPVVVGATRTERTIYEVDGAGYDQLSEEKLLANVTELVGADNAARVIASYRRAEAERVSLRARLLHRHRRAGARRAGRGAQREESSPDLGLSLGLGDAGDEPARSPHHGDPLRDEPPR